jgi:RNA polymerase sigma-70 factor, ECF subfamily
MSTLTSTRHEEFMRTFIAAEPKIRVYALSCGVPFSSVDDLTQEAALVLWRRFEEYDRSRPFLPWALGITHHLVQEMRRKGSLSRRLLAPEVAERVARTCADLEDAIDQRRLALRGCMKKLPPHGLEVVNLRYGARLSLAEVSDRMRKGLSAVNMMLHRIRRLLLQCMEREVAR